eukprot:COSAG06_NODE_8599_length_2118_cov_45.241768_2_plen_262_part_00
MQSSLTFLASESVCRYPGLTNKVFEIYLCRHLGPDTYPRYVLHTDYGIDCDDTNTLRWTLGLALVLLWPIGVPTVLFCLMFRARTKIISKDEDATGMFNFLIGDFKPEYWFWEVVELFRKLLLSGILSLVGRGSIAQAALGTVISFAFFALHLRLLPYKSPTLNVIKAISEIQMFAVLLLSVILQSYNVGFDSEVITVDDYGLMQTVATVLIAPVVICLIAYNVKGLAAKAEDTVLDGMVTANPLAQSIDKDEADTNSAEN